MESTQVEIKEVSSVVNEADQIASRQLLESQLAISCGGLAEVSLI